MSTIRVNRRTNRLTIILRATNRIELLKVVAAVKKAAPELKPGFTCLTDFRKVLALLSENRDLLADAQKLLVEIGIGKAARIISPGQYGSLPFKILEALPADYSYDYATSLKAGELLLDSHRPAPGPEKPRPRASKMHFKYMDRSGWEQATTAPDFYSTLRKLRKLRNSGRRNAIIVDAGFKLRI